MSYSGVCHGVLTGIRSRGTEVLHELDCQDKKKVINLIFRPSWSRGGAKQNDKQSNLFLVGSGNRPS